MMSGGMDGMKFAMRTTKLGKLSGISIARIVKPVGVRLRCEFVSAEHPRIEFEISGDLALGIAKEMELLLPQAQRRKSNPASR